MSQIPEIQPTNNDEIDLLRFIEKILRFFKKNRYIILISVIIGLTLGILMYTTTPKKYSATLLVQSSILANAEQIQVITNWNDLIKKNEKDVLAQYLNSNRQLLEKLRSIEAVEILKLYIEKNPIGFTIKVLVTDTTILDTLQRAIIYGLENGEYVKARVDARKEDLNKLITKVQQEIAQLDSTKSGVERTLQSGKGTGSSIMVNLSDVNTQMITLNEKLLDYANELKFISPIKVIQSFIKYKNPVEPKLPKYMGLGLLSGFLIGYLVAFFRLISSRLRQAR